MAKITTQFAFFNTKAAYNTQMSGDGFSDTTIIFIKDTQEIFTHGAKICSMQDIISLLEADYLQKTGGDINGNVNIKGTLTTGAISVEKADINVMQGNVYAENIEANTSIIADSVMINDGTADQILLGNGSTTSLQELKNAISSIPKFSVKVTSALPSTGDESTIYLLKSGGDKGNLYTEYLYVNGAYEKLGEQKLDLSGYALKTDVAAKMPTSATASNNSGEIELLFGNEAGQYLFSVFIEPATATAPGLMSASDKNKLDGIEAGANNYVLPAASETAIGGVKINNTVNSSPIVNVPDNSEQGADRTYYIQKSSVNDALVVTVPWENTTYGNATLNTAGLMSAADKAKLDLISWYEGN